MLVQLFICRALFCGNFHNHDRPQHEEEVLIKSG
jgi:hypothetical protein